MDQGAMARSLTRIYAGVAEHEDVGEMHVTPNGASVGVYLYPTLDALLRTFKAMVALPTREQLREAWWPGIDWARLDADLTFAHSGWHIARSYLLHADWHIGQFPALVDVWEPHEERA